MTEPERTTIARLRAYAEALSGNVPALEPVLQRATRRRRNRRVAVVVAATVLAVAIVVPLRALSGLGDNGGATTASEQWRETYVLSEFEVTYPFVDPPSDRDDGSEPDPTKAGISFRSAWSGDTYPGEAPCSIELFDRDGARIGSQSFNFATLTPRVDHDATIVISVAGAPPVRADGACGPGTPPGPGTYVFTDLRVVTDGDSQLTGDVRWSGDEPPLDQSCIASFTLEDGTHGDHSFTLSVGHAVDGLILLLPPGFAGATPLGVFCEPYTGPDQRIAPPPSPAPGTVTYEDPDDAFSLALPPDWHVSDRPLTHLIDPTEIFSAGTFDMTPGGSCPQFPTNSVAEMGPHDAFVTILERNRLGPAGAQAPPRPAAFSPSDGTSTSDVAECLGTTKAYFDRWIAFSDQGREFYAFVAMGQDVSDQRRDDTWAMLDSLVFDPPQTYILSELNVEYMDVTQGQALVTFRSTWSGEVSPGESNCEIRLLDGTGNVVGSSTFRLSTDEPSVVHGSGEEVTFEQKPVSAEGSCAPGTPAGSGS